MTHEIQLTCNAFLLHQTTGLREAGLEIRSLVNSKTPQDLWHRFGARQDRHFRRFFAAVRP